MATQFVRIRIRRDTAANWSANNPILKSGEPGLEIDSRKLKFGDGVTAWNNLQYASGNIDQGLLLEDIDDRVAALIKAGSNISLSYNDGANELTISAVGLQLAGDYASLVNGKVPSSQLPSYVDDVIEATNLEALPISGETGKIYVTLDNNKTYRWSGSTYVEISASPGSTDAVPEGSVNKYYTDARASAAAPVQSVAGQTGAVTLSKNDVGLSNVDNTSDVNKPVSTAQAAADSAVQSAAESDATAKADAAKDYAIQRSNHTGTQAISTVDGLQTALDNKATSSHNHNTLYRKIQTISLGFSVPSPITAEKNTEYVFNENNLIGPNIIGNFVINDPVSASHGDAYIVNKPCNTMHNVVIGGVTYDKSSVFYIYRYYALNGLTLSWKTVLLSPVQSVAGKIGNVTLTKSDVGLSNVDNTSDVNKPVSTAQAAADTAVQNAAATDATTKANNAQAFAIQRSNHTGTQAISTVDGLQTALDGKASTNHTHDDRYYTESEVDNLLSAKQASGDYANLVNGTVPASQLPSYVDDVIEATNLEALPISGETGKIYVTLDNNKTYRWSGSTYVEISASPGSTDAVPEGSVNKYYTDARASAAAPVQSVAGQTGAVTLSKNDVGLSNVDNTSDANKPVSTAQAEADTAVQTAAANDATAKVNNAQAYAIDRANHIGTQSISTIDSLQEALNAKQASGNYANSVHTHSISDVSGLQAAIDSKQASGEYASVEYVSDELLNKADALHYHIISDIENLQDELDSKQASGNYATLVNGKVPESELPSSVNDVLEYASLSAFPTEAETSKIYVALDNNKIYRWNGSSYIEISVSPSTTDSLLEGTTNLYYTDSRASLAAPVQSVSGKTGDVTLTKNDVGLTNVDNTSDANKPVSTATQTALDTKAPTVDPVFTGTVSGITKSMVGLGNVDNTSDVNKPVSTAQQTALNLKANIDSPTFTGTVNGITKSMVGLSNVDNTNDASKPVSSAQQTSLNLKANLASPTFTGTVSGITKSMVGLGNVDNTSDASKPISTATQTALDAKAPIANPTFTGTVSGITKSMVGLGNVDNTSDANKPVSADQQAALNLKANINNPTFTGTVNGITKSMVGLSNVDNTSDTNKPVSTAQALADTAVQTAASSDATTKANNAQAYAIQRSNHTGTQDISTINGLQNALDSKQLAGNYATLVDGKVPPAQLPSYVDEIQEYSSLALFPTTGNVNVIYRDTTSGSLYRWSGSAYINMSNSIQGTTDDLLEGSVNLYFTNQRASSAAPVQSVSGKTGTVTLNKNDVGLTNVDNTSDINKPVSTAQQTALDLKANINSPTFTGTVGGITKDMVGLTNVDNTSDIDKPVSNAQQAALDLKANTNSPTFTGTVSGITKSMVGLGNVDNTSDANKPVSTAQQAALDLKANLASPTFTGTVSGITKSMVGLGNTDNTSDLNKPISTATQAALDLKSNIGHTHTLAELLSWLSEPGTRNIYVDNGRTDTYTEDGSQYKPFKTMRAALASVSSASSLSDMNDTTKRFYCFRIAPGFYDEESGGTLNIPFRPGIVFDLTGGATLKGNYLWSRPSGMHPASGSNTTNVTAAITTGSNSITVSTSHVNYSRLKVGSIMTGTGMPLNTVITAINGSTVTLNNNATSTGASANLVFDSGELGIFVFAMIGSNHRPMFNNGAHSFVGIQGNLTVHNQETGNGVGWQQVHLTNCGVRGVIEMTCAGPSALSHLYAYQNATFDTLKSVGNQNVTLYASDCQNSSGGNGFGNIIGNVWFNTLEQVVFHSYASIFSTGRLGVYNMDATFMPAYNEIKATSFTRTNNVATVTLSLNHGQSRNILPDGYWREQYVLINGVTENTSFNTPNFGAKVVDFPTANTVSYENTGPDVSVAVTAANAKWIKGTFFGNSSTAGYIQPNPVSLSLNEAAIHTHPGWNTNTQPGLGSAFLTARSAGVTFRYPAVGWAASSQYVRNRVLLPGNGYQYRNVTTTGVGRSGTTAPTWPTTIGGTVVDGSITWSCEQLSFPLAGNLGFTGGITSGSNQVTVTLGSVLAANFQVGYVITGTGIPANTTITAISGSALTLSANATATNASATLTVAGTSAISYNVQHALEVLHDSRNIYHNQIDSGIAGAATVQQALKSLKGLVDGAASNINNITKATVGLGNVDNTSDANKPVSTAQQTALDLKANINSPTFTGTVSGITKSMVGLGNVDNTSDASKPVSVAQQAALDLKANINSPTFTGTVSGITKSMVGLSNVDNTSDLDKPISNATQTVLNTKAAELTTVFDAGAVSGGTYAVPYASDKQMQLVSCSDQLLTITKGSGWPTTSVSADVILKLTLTTNTTINWNIVTEWYNQPPSSANGLTGTHLILFRSVGPNTIEGHYIGSKASV